MEIISIKLIFLAFLSSLFITIPAAHADDGDFKLLTLNLLFSEPTTSEDSDGEERFLSIANFIGNEEIDCALFQEVVGGQLAKELGLTESLNSLLDLNSELDDDFELRWRLANGIPLVFSVGNAILCRAPIEIKWTVARSLPFASEITINGIDIKLRRKIMGCLLDNVPGFGKLLLFNVHLCAFCPTEQRQAQINEALEFVDTVRTWVRWFHGEVPCVFGGDFNIRDQARASGSAFDEYYLITSAGFIDAYAEINGCDFGDGCCIPNDDPNIFEEGCTFAVGNNLFESNPAETTRIDYFFIQPESAFNMLASTAEVVFNGIGINAPFVSDHSGFVVNLVP